LHIEYNVRYRSKDQKKSLEWAGTLEVEGRLGAAESSPGLAPQSPRDWLQLHPAEVFLAVLSREDSRQLHPADVFLAVLSREDSRQLHPAEVFLAVLSMED
jgi:hypothetical protein